MDIKIYLDKEWLHNQYVILRKSVWTIGTECDVHGQTIHNYLKKYGIDRRGPSEAKASGNIEKFEELKEQIVNERLNGAKVKDLQKKYSGIGLRKISDLCKELPKIKYTIKKKVYTEEERKVRSKNSKRQWERMTAEQKENILMASIEAKKGSKNINYGKIWGGAGRGTRIKYINQQGREICLRSTWEKKFADYLNVSGFKWYYEEKTFDCGGLGTYTPDFYVDDFGCFVEVKGWLKDEALNKVNYVRNNYDCNIVLATKDVLINQYNVRVR